MVENQYGNLMDSYRGPEQEKKNNNYADVDVDRFDDSIDS